jgi:hypothetical protein
LGDLREEVATVAMPDFTVISPAENETRARDRNR